MNDDRKALAAIFTDMGVAFEIKGDTFILGRECIEGGKEVFFCFKFNPEGSFYKVTRGCRTEVPVAGVGQVLVDMDTDGDIRLVEEVK